MSRRTRHFCSLSMVMILSDTGASAHAQCFDWTQRPTSAQPSARGHARMARNPTGGGILFGGTDAPGVIRDDTWIWDGTSWIEKTGLASKPSARSGHTMAFDIARGEVVLFGGHDGSYRDDTWVWNGTSWTEKTGLATKPGPRSWHALAYDEDRQVVVLFGGWSGSAYLGDTWEWNGTSWAPRAVSGPSAREGHAIAYYPGNGIVLFGGGAGSPNNETWTWDGTSWTKKTPPGGQPTPQRYWNSMVYDSARQRDVLFGGGDLNLGYDDTWEWDGSRWHPMTSIDTGGRPSARHSPAMAFDTGRGKVVLFGGYVIGSTTSWLSDTWEYPSGPSVTCIPTLSEWGLIAMGLLTLTAGTTVVMRRRRAAGA